MEVLLGVLGVGLLVLTLVDALWTTLWVDGAAGPVTSRVTSWAWRVLLRLAGHRHRVLSLSGPLILVGTVLGWVLGLWVGWVVLFSADPQSLVDAREDGYADWTGRIWFVAYAMFTMGNGDFSPADGLWQLLASLVNGSGMFLVTLAITYVLSVVSAVVDKRAFASSVHALGRDGAALVLSGWSRGDLHALDRQLAQLSSQLAGLAEQYLSYPVLQYYHAARAEKSPALAAAVLDEALTLLRHGVAPDVAPDVAALTSARATVASFLQTMDVAFVPAAPEAPAPPDLQRLRDAGVPTVGDDEFSRALEDFDERRRSLLGLVRNDGWDWWRD